MGLPVCADINTMLNSFNNVWNKHVMLTNMPHMVILIFGNSCSVKYYKLINDL